MHGPPTYGGIFDFDVKSEKLEQVNGELEDPNIWNDPKHAQDLGKEKKSLEAIVVSLTNIDAGLRDAADLFDMAREEQDDDTLLAVEQDAHALETQVEGMEFRRMFANTCVIASARAARSKSWNSQTAKWLASRPRRSRSRVNMPTAFCVARAACTGWCASRRSIRPADGIPRLPAFLCTRKSTNRSKSKSIRPMCASTPSALPAPAASTSTRPIPPCA